MNKSYISVWNDALGTWVAAPETATLHSGKGAASSCSMSPGVAAVARPARPFKAALMPIAMAIGAVMSPGAGATEATTGNGGLELCPAGGGGVGSSWGPLSSAVGIMNCTAPAQSGSSMSFSLNNGAAGNGAWGFNDDVITARVTGYDNGLLELQGAGGISMLNAVNMNGNKITSLASGNVSQDSADAVNGDQLYQATRYFKANSPSNDPSTDALAKGANSVASGPSAMAVGANSSAYGANAVALVSNSVALGAGSVASRSDAVSIGYLSADGKSQYTRQITNLTAGAAGTDAVNVNQLNAAIASVSGGGTGGVTDNAVTYDSSASTRITLKGASGTRITNLSAGDISSAWSTDAVNGSQLYQTNQNVTNVVNNVANMSGNLANVTNVVNNIVNNGIAGNPLVVTYDSSARDAVTLGGVGVGKTVKLSNVAAGDISSQSSTDAVNGGQLFQTNQNLHDLADNVGQITTNIYNRGVKYFHTNSSLADSSAVGTDSVALGGFAIAQADNSVALGSNSLADRANAVSVGAAGAERQIVNVAAGTQNNDAVNLAQMNTAISNASISGGGSPDAVIYDSSAHDKLTLGGALAPVPVALTNVAAGHVVSGSTDAVNAGQLYNTSSSVAAALGAGATVGKDGTVSAPGYIISGTTYGNVGDAFYALNGAAGDLVSAAKYVKVISTGNAAMASGTEAVAIGGAAMATGSHALAIGAGATAGFANSTAIGVNAITDAVNTVSVGARGAEMRITHVANGLNPTDAATVAQLDALQTQLLKSPQQSGGVKSMLLGAAVPVTNYIAVSSNVTGGGNTSASSDLNAMAIGPVSAATGINALAVGGGSAAGSNASTAVGSGAGALSVNSTAIGAGATVGAVSDNSVSIGYNARSSALNATALGGFASATGVGSVAIGYNAFVNPSATNGMALGLNASVSAANAVAIGYNSTADRANAVSVGSASKQSQITYVAAGTSNTDAVNVKQLSGVISTIGGGAAMKSDGTIQNPSFAVGGQTYTDVGSAIAAAAATGSANSVQYDTTARSKVTLGGSGSTVPVTLSNVANGVANNDAVNVAQLQAMGATIGTSGVVTNSFVAYDDTSHGSITLKGVGGTTIANVKAGALTATSLDAVNGSQLYQTNANVANVAGNVANVTNTVNNIVVNGGGIKYFHVNSTLADSSASGANAVAIGGAANASGTNSVALGTNSVASRANSVSVGAAGSERQIVNVANGTNGTDAVNVAQLQAMGATIGTSGVVTNSFVAYDDSTKAKVSFGGTGATKAVTLSNVANGVANNDAVNLAQLKQMGASIDTSGVVTNSFVSYDDTSRGSITLKGVGGTTIANVKAGALTATSLDAVNGSQLYETNANVANVAGNVANVTNTVNNIVVNGGGIKYFHVNSTLADSSASGANAVAIGGAANASGTNSVALGTNSVASRANAVSVGAAGSERQIVNVANGTNGTDAVNVAQLQAMGATIGTSGVVTNSFVAYDDSTKAKVTLGGAGSTVPVTLTNIAAGKVAATSSDAVNGSQLYKTADSIAKAIGGGAVTLADGTLSAPSYEITGSTYNDVGSALNAVDGQLDQINTNFSTNLKYVKVVSTAAAAQASGSESIAIGGNAMATGDHALAIGSGATATYRNSTAIGVNAVADADNTVSVGARGAEMRITHVANGLNPTDAATVAQLSALQKQLVQSTQQSNGLKSMLLGATAAVTDYIAVSPNVTQGSRTSASPDLNAMAIGPVAAATGTGALAVGAGSIAGSNGSTAVGSYAMVGSINSTSIGAGAQVGVESDNSVAIGYNARSSAMNAMAMGTSASATSAGSVALGYNTFINQSATNGLALGMNASVSAANGVAIGYNSVADRANAVSVGSSKQQSQIINVAAGTQNTDAVNLGQMTAAINAASSGGSPDSVVYDTAAHTSVTLGNAASPVKLANVADGSANNDAVNVAQLKAMGATIGTSGAVTNAFVAYDDTAKGKVTFGGAGSTTPVVLTNVAAGQITSSSKDAINGTQLYNTASSTAAALGGGSTVGADGKVSKPTYTLNGTTYSDVGAALIAAASGGDSPEAVKYDTTSHNKVTLGNAGKPVTLSNVADGVANNDAVNVEQLKAMGATIGTSGVVTNAFVAYDDTTKGKVTFGGIGASAPVVLTNVGAGQITSSSKDAINGAQLYSTASSMAAALGGGSTVNANGEVSKPAYKLSGNTFNDVGAALAAVDAKATTGSVNGVVYDSSAHDKVTLGNVGVPVTIANVAAATSDDEAVNLKQLKDAGLNVDPSGHVTNAFVAYDNATRGSVTFNAGGAPTQLKNVAAASDLTDAVNFGQMQTYVSQNTGGGTANGVAYDDSTKTQVTLGGVGATTPVTLTNVAAGSGATDAVNFSQFSSLQSQINNLAGGTGNTTFVNINTPADGGTAAVASGSDSIAIGNGAAATGAASIAIGKNTVTAGDNSVAMGAGATAPNTNSVALGANATTDRDNSVSVGSVGATRQITNVAAGTQSTDAVNLGQLNNAMGNMSNTINNVDRNAAKGIASASALNIVTPYLPGRTTLNAGVANYRGYQAVGLGVSRWNEKGTINYNLGVSSSGGNSTIVRAGIGIVLGN
ncbi:YadA-like family protein [Paraburkholderia bryophila]|uniref:YadA-like family protein n=1 Tax=Paraburkholderia bryophila TaxID=420952 RepID=UPI00234BD96B|nr:YadA-like family protein [Paraburkholderia bryophila]WCM23274.1 YadA-like family protein [Paraburkholderia bryophila]